MTSRTRKLTIGAVVVVMLAVALLSRDAKLPLAVDFVRYQATNKESLMAVLQVSNHTPFDINCHLGHGYDGQGTIFPFQFREVTLRLPHLTNTGAHCRNLDIFCYRSPSMWRWRAAPILRLTGIPQRKEWRWSIELSPPKPSP